MKRPVLASALLLTLSACVGPGLGQDNLGGLDQNGDGELSEADVDDGELAIFFELVPASGEASADEAQALTTLDATLSPGGSGGWYLTADLDGQELSLRFENDGEGLTAAEGLVTNASYDVDDETFAYASEPGGSIAISEVSSDGTTASGRVTGSVELEVFDQMESPTGDLVHIEAFAFKSIAVALPDAS